MNNLTLHQQFMLTSIVILICTAMATLLTWLISFAVLVTDNSMFRPANYYEKQLPAIFAYVDQQKEQLLHPSARQELEKVIPVEGMDYQVSGRPPKCCTGRWNKEPYTTCGAGKEDQHLSSASRNHHPLLPHYRFTAAVGWSHRVALPHQFFGGQSEPSTASTIVHPRQFGGAFYLFGDLHLSVWPQARQTGRTSHFRFN